MIVGIEHNRKNKSTRKRFFNSHYWGKFTSWWYQERCTRIPNHSELQNNLDPWDCHTDSFFKVYGNDFNILCNNFMTHLSGKNIYLMQNSWKSLNLFYKNITKMSMCSKRISRILLNVQQFLFIQALPQITWSKYCHICQEYLWIHIGYGEWNIYLNSKLKIWIRNRSG